MELVIRVNKNCTNAFQRYSNFQFTLLFVVNPHLNCTYTFRSSLWRTWRKTYSTFRFYSRSIELFYPPVKIAEVEFITIEKNVLSLKTFIMCIWIIINNIFIKIGSVQIYIDLIVQILRFLNISLSLEYSIICMYVYIFWNTLAFVRLI